VASAAFVAMAWGCQAPGTTLSGGAPGVPRGGGPILRERPRDPDEAAILRLLGEDERLIGPVADGW